MSLASLSMTSRRRPYGKRILAGLFACLFAALGAIPALPAAAHDVGEPAFFKINDKFIVINSQRNDEVKSVPIPQTVSTEKYVVGHEIRFEVVKAFIKVSPEARERSTYTIDFGDGSKADDVTASHVYENSGTYFVKVYAKDGASRNLIESAMIDVLPNAGYQLPKVIGSINGQPADDIVMTYKADLSQPVKLDASATTDSSARIVKYHWDFADGSTSTERAVTHSYQKNKYFVAPMVRVTDSNGLIADAQVPIQNVKGAASAANDSGGSWIQGTYERLAQDLKLSLSKALSGEQTNYGLAFLILLFAAVAGALHSLTPGHGKSVMAALMIGRKRSKLTDIVIVASAITLTHTAVIFGLGIAFAVLDAKMPLSSIVGYFEKVSAVLIILLAGALIYSGWKKIQHDRAHHRHGHDHHHGHDHDGEHGHKHVEAKDFNRVDSRWGLFAVGASGGIIPCIDALSLLLLSVSLGHVVFGLFIVLAFSLGLAASIIAIGLLLLYGKRTLPKDGKLARFADIYAPIVSGAIIFVIALTLLF